MSNEVAMASRKFGKTTRYSTREPSAFPLEILEGPAVPHEAAGPQQEVQRKPNFNQAHEQIEMSTGLQIVEKMKRHHQPDDDY